MRLFPRLAATLAVAALTTAGLVTTTPAAEAAAKPTVSIATIKNRTAKYRKTVTVEVPKVTAKGNVELGSKSFTIKRGKKTVVKNKTSAKLKAGTYKVTTSARYTTWAMVTKHRIEQRDVVVLPAGTSAAVHCTVQTTTLAENAVSYLVELGCTSDAFTGTQLVPAQADGDEVNGWTVAPVFTHAESAAATAPAGPLEGFVFDTSTYFDHDLVETRSVSVTYQVKETSKTKVATRTQKLKIKQGAKPGRTDPVSTWNCPSWAPIKGNAQSMIYHLPSQRFYDRTMPEDCFSTQKAAKKAGYRKSKV